MVDSLEKFQKIMVNVYGDEGKEFILFKRQLYQMYEVQNRSKTEHAAFSLGVERKNLQWLYQANLDFVKEMTRINHLDNLAAHGKLKGSIYKTKRFGLSTQKGLAAIGVSIYGYMNLLPLSLMVGPMFAKIGLIGTAIYGTTLLREREVIS